MEVGIRGGRKLPSEVENALDIGGGCTAVLTSAARSKNVSE
jgi:hypothetical protein